jgi:hypothetical protein
VDELQKFLYELEELKYCPVCYDELVRHPVFPKKWCKKHGRFVLTEEYGLRRIVWRKKEDNTRFGGGENSNRL